MIPYNQKRAYDLRCKAEAIEARDRLVAVELSESAAWVLRDLIGLGHLPADVSLMEDMQRLNKALGYRPHAPENELPEPHVSGWSSSVVAQRSAA